MAVSAGRHAELDRRLLDGERVVTAVHQHWGKVAEWRHDWFVATDKRLLLFYGFITRRVSMMPLLKVTDMSYERSVPGRILGFGRFVMESAGHDHALRAVNWVPHPDHHYRVICAQIFGVADHERPVDDEDP